MKIVKRVYCAEFKYDENDIRHYSEDKILLHENLIAESDDWLFLLTKVNMSIQSLIDFRDSELKELLVHEYHGQENQEN